MSLLNRTDFQNKEVVPFMTYGGYYGSFFEKFKAAAKNANIINEEGHFRNSNNVQLTEEVYRWLNTLEQPKSSFSHKSSNDL